MAIANDTYDQKSNYKTCLIVCLLINKSIIIIGTSTVLCFNEQGTKSSDQH